MRTRVGGGADGGMKHVYAIAIDIPIGESSFLAAAVGASLKYLRADREEVTAALRRDFVQRRAVERHVVVHQINPVVSRLQKTSFDRGAESKRAIVMGELDVWKRVADAGVSREGRTIRDDDYLMRFVDVLKRGVDRRQRSGQHLGRIAIRNDDRQTGLPSVLLDRRWRLR